VRVASELPDRRFTPRQENPWQSQVQYGSKYLEALSLTNEAPPKRSFQRIAFGVRWTSTLSTLSNSNHQPLM
jgi:hypothetical protein